MQDIETALYDAKYIVEYTRNPEDTLDWCCRITHILWIHGQGPSLEGPVPVGYGGTKAQALFDALTYHGTDELSEITGFVRRSLVQEGYPDDGYSPTD